MKPTGSKVFRALVAAQVLFLLGWAGYHEYVRSHAAVILLKGRPVDPQDLLRGDFMTLRFDVSTVDLPPDVANGAEVWVLLEPRGKYHEVVSAGLQPPAAGPGQVLVRGNVSSRWPGGTRASREEVVYGIETYFVPEGKGTPRFQLMEVQVSVSPAHRLYLKQVLLDGQPFP